MDSQHLPHLSQAWRGGWVPPSARPLKWRAPGAAAFSPRRCLLFCFRGVLSFFSLGGRWQEADPAPWLSLPPASRAVLGGELGVPRWLGCSVASVASGSCLPSGPPSLTRQWGGRLTPPPLGLMGAPRAAVMSAVGLPWLWLVPRVPWPPAAVRGRWRQGGCWSDRRADSPGTSWDGCGSCVCVFGGWWGGPLGRGGCWLVIDDFREVGSQDPECSLGPAVHTSESRASSPHALPGSGGWAQSS